MAGKWVFEKINKLFRIKVAVSVAQKVVMLLFVVISYMICINMRIERKIKQFCITLGPHTFILGKITFTCMSLEENNLILENPFPFSKNRSAEIFYYATFKSVVDSVSHSMFAICWLIGSTSVNLYLFPSLSQFTLLTLFYQLA